MGGVRVWGAGYMGGVRVWGGCGCSFEGDMV
jgi:hypothetical protein